MLLVQKPFLSKRIKHTKQEKSEERGRWLVDVVDFKFPNKPDPNQISMLFHNIYSVGLLSVTAPAMCEVKGEVQSLHEDDLF